MGDEKRLIPGVKPPTWGHRHCQEGKEEKRGNRVYPALQEGYIRISTRILNH